MKAMCVYKASLLRACTSVKNADFMNF